MPLAIHSCRRIGDLYDYSESIFCASEEAEKSPRESVEFPAESTVVAPEITVVPSVTASLLSLPQSRPSVLQKVKASAIPTKVAFCAYLSKDFDPTLQDTDLILDTVETNIGDAYDVNYGRFTAPVSATYQFSVTISAQEGQKAAVDVLKNGRRVMTVWADSNPTWATSTSDTILSMEAGHRVWLKLLSKASSVYGNMYTSFSGFLLFEN